MFWAKRKLHSKKNFIYFFKSRHFIYSFTAFFYVAVYSIVQGQLHWHNQGVGMCVEADREVGISLASFAVTENASRATMVANTD